MHVSNSLQAVNIPTYHYVAIDLHSTNAVVCVKVNAVDKQGALVGKTIYRGTVSIYDGTEAFEKCMQRYCEDVPHTAIVESTYNRYALADIFEQRGWVLRVADPSTVSHANIKAADDKSDAEYLAERLRVGSIKSYLPLNKEDRALRDLCRHRMALVQQRASYKIKLVNMYRNQLSKPLAVCALLERAQAVVQEHYFVPADVFEEFSDINIRLKVATMLSQILLLRDQIALLDEHIQNQCKSIKLDKLCRTLPGCGPVLAAVVATEIGSMERFAGAANFVSYCRLCSTSKLSNGKSKGFGNAKNGNAYLSWAFTEIAQHALVNRTIRAIFDRLLKKYHGLRVKAIRTLAAKIARAAYYVLKNEVPFELAKCFGCSRPSSLRPTQQNAAG